MRLLPPLLFLVLLAGCGESGREASTRDSSPAPSVEAAAPDGTSAAGTNPTGGANDGARRPLRYAVLGDSYSNGQSASPEAAWPVQLAARLTQDGLPVRVVANPSVTGATTAQMLDTGLGPIRASRPDVITVMLGVNDQVQGRTTTQFDADEDRAVRAAIEIAGSPSRVLVVDIPDYSVSPAGAQFGEPKEIASQIDAFNAVVHRVAARRRTPFVSIVDLSRKLGAGGIAGDGLHPSAGQLTAWTQRIEPAARQAWDDLEPGAG